MNSDAVNPVHDTGSRPRSHDTAASASADEDAGLLQAFASGDVRAFESLYRKHRPWLYRVILRQVENERRAESIFQDVWLTVTRRAADWTPQAQVATWLYSLARSRIVEGWPGTASKPSASVAVAASASPDPTPRPNPADAVEPTAPAQRLLRSLADLPPLHREAYLLAVEAGLSLPEVARATGSTLDGARARVWGARASLATALGPMAEAGA